MAEATTVTAVNRGAERTPVTKTLKNGVAITTTLRDKEPERSA